MTDYLKLMEAFQKEYEAKTFSEKIFFNSMFPTTNSVANHYMSGIRLDGYVAAKDSGCVKCNNGDCYVYLWKHALTGKVFYVGSGTKERWKQKYRKNEEFLRNIDEGDSVVYKVVDGITREEASFYEKYLSYSFGMGGIVLSNKDNNVEIVGIDSAKRWISESEGRISDELTKKIEENVLNRILDDRKISEVEMLGIYKFRETYGTHFFSDLVDTNN